MANNKFSVYLKYYSFPDLVHLVYRLILTKLTFRNARLIRSKIDLRGKRNIQIGKGFTCGRSCRLETSPYNHESKLIFGDNVELNDFVHITAFSSVTIGNNVLMASRIYISDTSHGSYAGNEMDSSPESVPNDRPLFHKSVVIEDNVWIGENVAILPGSYIGKGTVIGANAVVSGRIPEFSIAVGVPARVIKKFNFSINKWEKV